jgi:hypothetical protein
LALLDLLERKELLEILGHKVQSERQVQLDLRVFREQLVLKV